MGRLVGMITRVAMWAALGAAVGFIGALAYQMGFKGGALDHVFSSIGARSAAGIGLVIGGVIGFFRRD
jgi:hypothetical protein